jgi:hypothetical protein
MARTDVPAQTLARYPSAAPAAGSADLTWTAATVSGGNDSAFTPNKTILFMRNTGVAAHSVTITSAPDSLGRLGDLGPYVLAAGKVARFGPFVMEPGWSTAGRLLFSADHAEVQFAVLTLA